MSNSASRSLSGFYCSAPRSIMRPTMGRQWMLSCPTILQNQHNELENIQAEQKQIDLPLQQ